MPASRVNLSALEQRILDRVFIARDGFERLEDLLAETGVDGNTLVDALESLEGEGYLAISNLGGNIVVASEDVLGQLFRSTRVSVSPSTPVGQC